MDHDIRLPVQIERAGQIRTTVIFHGGFAASEAEDLHIPSRGKLAAEGTTDKTGGAGDEDPGLHCGFATQRIRLCFSETG